MRKSLKALIACTALACAFVFGLFIATNNNVYAEEVATDTTTETTTDESTTTDTTTTEEDDYTLGTGYVAPHIETVDTEYIDETGTADTTTTEDEATTDTDTATAIDEAIGAANSLYEYIKTLDMETVKGWITAIGAFLGIDVLTLIGIAIAWLRLKLKSIRESEAYKNALAKQSAEFQAKEEELAKEYDEKLENFQKTVLTEIKKQNNEKKQLAQNNVDLANAALSEITVELDK